MTRPAKQVDAHVGRRIRERRVQVGLTQQDLANLIGVTYQQLQKYETAANRVSAGRLFEIADRLGVGVSFFFEGIRPTTKQKLMEHGGKQRALLDLVRHFEAIKDPKVRSAVSGLVKSIAGRSRWHGREGEAPATRLTI